MQFNILNANGWTLILLFFSFLAMKNTTMNNIITINDVHVSRARANIDVANETNYM